MGRNRFIHPLRATAVMLGVIACTLLLHACAGGKGGQQELLSGSSEQSAQLDSLQALLDSELLRLGVDTSREASIAPSAGNAVFDLQATVTTVVPGEQADVTLRWTERLVGDYDQNGLVNAADLVPLARHFGEAVSYRSALDTDGIEGWPTGLAYDPGDAANWRLARIDGNMDGEINAGDVTPIAQHWQQSLSGYRVYRQHGDQESAELLAGPEETLGLFSVERSAPDDNNLPVSYSFSDTLTDAGEYLYYVAAYDADSEGEGPPSRPVRPSLNIPPVATLSVNPPGGAAPLQVSLDASASSDPDGRIVSYEFDLDGDGKYDQSGIDPDATTSFGSGSHTVRLRVTDDGGATDSIDLTINVGDEIIPLITSNKQADMLPAVFLLDSTQSQVSIPLATVEWFVNDDELPSQSSTELDTFLFEPVFTGFYQVRLVLTSQAGHSYETKISLQVYDGDDSVPRITVNQVEDSLPADFVLSADESILVLDLQSCEWLTGFVPELEQSTPALADFTPSFATPGLKQVTLRLTDVEGGHWQTTQMLYVYPAPEAVISGADKGFWEDEIANLSGAGSLGAINSYEWDLDASWVNGSDDNVFETDYVGQQIGFECRFDEQFSLTLRVTDRFGKVDELSSVIDSWRKPSLSCGIDDPYWAQGEVVYQGQEVDLYIGIGGPTELFGNWTVEFPGSNMTALTGTAQPNTFLVPVSWMISGEFLVRVSVDQLVSEVPPSGLTKEFTVNVAAFDPQFTADSFFKPLDSTINFDNSGSVSDLPVSSYSWDYESDGIIDDTGLAPQVSRTFAPGKYLVTMYMHADNGYVRSVSHEAGVLGGTLRIIRNDGGLYDSNYDAITADLDSLGYGWSSVDYYPGIAADEAITGTPVYIWYRGGPGSASEPAPYTTVWTTSEIDDYIALMDAGKPLLLMSQSHGKDNDLDLRDPPLDPDGPDGWNIFYGMDKLANSVPKAEVRHVNAAGFSTDDEIGFGGSLSLPMCPQNLSLAGSIILDSGYSQNNGIFYKGLGSNSRRAYKIQIAECYQLCGTGMYDTSWGFSNYASPKFEHGMATPFYLGYQLGFLSYGNEAAPDANIGFWPSYTHVYGPSRLWVVGYPWSQMSVTQAFDQNSQQVPMSRDAALQNILGWLREDEWAAF